MDFSIPITRTIHLIGFSMAFGGTLTSFILSIKATRQKEASHGAFIASHFVAAPGLIILLLTGLASSVLFGFAQFKYAGYMHAKMALVALTLCFMWMDIRGQAIIRRSFQQSAEKTALRKGLMQRRIGGLCTLLCLGAIVILMEFKPF